jgi:hypothetical protein
MDPNTLGFTVQHDAVCSSITKSKSSLLIANMNSSADLNCQGVNRFTQLADDSDEVPKLQGAKLYMGFWLSPQEWKDLKLMYDVLQVRYFSLTITGMLTFYGTRNLQMPSKHSQRLTNLPFGAQSQSLNFFKRHGKPWPTLRNSAASQWPSRLGSIIFRSGTIRPMTLVYTSSALVCTIFKYL